jgi:hypothetical protein
MTGIPMPIKIAHDAEHRLVEALMRLFDAHTKDTQALGQSCLELRNYYSERRDLCGRHTSSGHGIYVAKLAELGISRYAAARWVHDYVAARDGKPSTAAKQKARRSDVVASFRAHAQRAKRLAAQPLPESLEAQAEIVRHARAAIAALTDVVRGREVGRVAPGEVTRNGVPVARRYPKRYETILDDNTKQNGAVQ